MATLKYWLWLTTRRGVSNVGAFGLLDHFGTPEAVYFADPAEYDLVPEMSRGAKTSLLDKSMEEPERILAECDRLGIHITTVADAGYPDRLRSIYDPPAVLYWKGRELRFDDEVAIGLIGTRTPTAYGIDQAGKLGRELASQGAVVVSGLAAGLDTEGIKGALRGGGRVAAVLGNGIDVIYPHQNRYLYEDVMAAGVLVSEYPPGTRPMPSNFPSRNRIISGLSVGIIVVEGGLGSGTRITADHALEQNRDVFAVPGPVDAPKSVTPNQLIRDSAAKLITSASDVLVEYEGVYPHKIKLKPQQRWEPPATPAEDLPQRPPKPREPAAEKKVVDKEREIPYIHWKKLTPALTDDQRDILLALRDKPLVQEEIIEVTQIPARRASSAITMLQLSGFVTETAGKRFEATVRIGMEPGE